MRRRAGERGENNAGCIFWILVAVVVGLFLYKVVPLKVANAQLEDYMVDQARFAERSSAETLEKRILGKARDLGIPLNKKNLRVKKEGGRVKMKCRYTHVLKFPFYTHDWKIEIEVDRPVFII